MSFARYLKEIGRGAEGAGDLSERDAHQLFGAILDGGVPELELGAILLALRVKSESLPELIGFYGALDERLFRLRMPAGKAQPVILPSYSGARHQPNLLPLLALLLQRFGVPVLVHGALNGSGRIASAYVFRELGIMPCANLAQAQDALDNGGIVFVPTAVLAPGLAEVLSLRGRLGVRSSAHVVAKLIDPFEGEGLRVVSASHPPYLEKAREFLLATGARALLLRSTEGEPFADPKRRPRLEYFHDATAQVLFEAETGPLKSVPTLPSEIDAATTAAWIKSALAGETPVPMPLVNQLACCLFAAGYANDLNQVKAIVAVETGSFAAA
ncbi:MAG: DNA-binding protein YbiB [Betaproteobacteria bacterium]|nr:DNA-binding protein YbiB [Betaproteobacteria bacterium]